MSRLGTDIDKDFVNHLYAPNTIWPKVELNYVRLPSMYDFNLEEARFEYNKIQEKYPVKPFRVASKFGKLRDRLIYRGLGLTAKKSSQDPLYDALNLYGRDGQGIDIYNTFKNYSEKLQGVERLMPSLDESEFSDFTPACSPFFKKIIDKFQSPFTKVRFLELMPGGHIPPHVDFPYYEAIRVHSVLETNESVVWEVEGEDFQLPADGKFYWFDTGKYHSVINKGKTSRLVLSINLMVYKGRGQETRYSHQHDLLDLIRQGKI